MKPYRQVKNIKGGTWKKDYHPKKLGKGYCNWWEVVFDTIISRSAMKHRWKKEIKKIIEENY